MWRARRLAWGALAIALAVAAPAAAQQRLPRIWDIPFGTPIADLPGEFVDPSCGTNGGPAGQPLASFADFARCAPEASGLREVWFIYDDIREYIGLALRMPAIRSATTLLDQPVILSYLVDGDGRIAGLRVFTDPRADPDLRLAAHEVSLAFKARYDVGLEHCADQPAGAGETPIDGVYIKELCRLEAAGRRITIESRFFYKPGHQVVDPRTLRATDNEFESWARLEVLRAGPLPPPAARVPLAALPPGGDRRDAFLSGLSKDCPGCDLVGADLRRHDLAEANLAGANLEGAVLHRVNLRRANLEGATLRNANLNRANLGFANLKGADLSGALLYQAEASRADFSGTDLHNARMGRVNLALANLANANLDQVDLGEARLNDASLAGATLNGAFLPQAVMFRANLRGMVAERAVMVDVALRGANLSQARLRGSDLYGADLSGADLAAADFSGARLLGAKLADTSQMGTIFTGATMPDNTVHR
ncbi:MAG: pentapeptide repeat-containing protein [Alphaproteobacteria bacterium]|nr:pentapeptide repeat-containing protein [Alphaproteobacteria bacterium]